MAVREGHFVLLFSLKIPKIPRAVYEVSYF